ncbi:Fur family transcriptional regulator [Paenactinomyces guangxiensis]|uniref:Transcriptional repressor n=1 Tax=Paenactinomyces guangxiensis TaxID=1490290 RepID=A0A7W1WPA3_9BACL|nr:Fur family transcriptional regulator [Paenactinomyces guangxiensis]MBA4493551.1 transcriptional repressor [Paenactinomyces guangxiensis]MBH8590642.1 transcriptional repressor [Paenactinomyces guangxiensis]
MSIKNHHHVDAIETLKRMGVRITPQRNAILSYLLSSTHHPTAHDIYEALKDDYPNMSATTIYNNLRLFKQANIIRVTYSAASSRFDANLMEHDHVICRRCGSITDFRCPLLPMAESEIIQATGYSIESHRLEIYGLCPSCQTEEP